MQFYFHVMFLRMCVFVQTPERFINLSQYNYQTRFIMSAVSCLCFYHAVRHQSLGSGLPSFSNGPKLLCLFHRDRMSPSIRMRRVSASHLRPLLDESQRLLMARGVFAVHRVSTASHHQLLLQRKETLLQTRLPTVSPASLGGNLRSAFLCVSSRCLGFVFWLAGGLVCPLQTRGHWAVTIHSLRPHLNFDIFNLA